MAFGCATMEWFIISPSTIDYQSITEIQKLTDQDAPPVFCLLCLLTKNIKRTEKAQRLQGLTSFCLLSLLSLLISHKPYVYHKYCLCEEGKADMSGEAENPVETNT
jgi:hypothetical protein